MRDCIFCGKKPVSKTKEHIIPLWLIELTGDPKRKANLGSIGDPNRTFEWKNFCFSACDTCNSEFSVLELHAKKVIEKLLKRDVILTEEELTSLLDWLDKVRIGLWLGMIQLDKIDFIDPKYHIEQRIRKSDRLAAIYFLDDTKKGMNFFGINTVAFHFAPTCFLLTINNIAILNISKEFLFASRLGFPFPIKMFYLPNNLGVTFERFSSGFQRVKLPLLKKSLLPNSLNVYQSIITVMDDSLNSYLQSIPYFNSYSKIGMSKIFIEEPVKKNSFFMKNILRVNNYIQISRYPFLLKASIKVLEYQILTFTDSNMSDERLPEVEKKNLRELSNHAILFNKKGIKELQRLAFN